MLFIEALKQKIGTVTKERYDMNQVHLIVAISKNTGQEIREQTYF